VIITVTPNPGLDLTYVLTSSENDGDVRRADRSTIEASGKGINVTRALTRVGVPSWAVFPSGGRTGRLLRALLDEEGVLSRTAEQSGDVRLNTTALLPDQHTLKFNGPGSPLAPSEQHALLAAAEATLVEAAGTSTDQVWLAVCGSLPPQTDVTLVSDLVKLAHRHGARCVVDASGPSLVAALEAGADLIAPNRHELGEVSPEARSANSFPDLVVAAAEVSRRTQSQMLVSLGQHGALYTDGRSALHAWGPALVPVNSAGAGDALLAGWLLADSDPTERLVRAVTWGRSACLSETTVDLMPGKRDTSPISVRSIDLAMPQTPRAEGVPSTS
jgi:1-phosphofructokinase